MIPRRGLVVAVCAMVLLAAPAWAAESGDRVPMLDLRVGVPTLSILSGSYLSIADHGTLNHLRFRKPFAPVEVEATIMFPVSASHYLGPAYKFTGNLRADDFFTNDGARKGNYDVMIHSIGMDSVWASYAPGRSGLGFFAMTRLYLNYGFLNFDAKHQGESRKTWKTSGLGATIEPIVMQIFYRAPFGLCVGAEVNMGEVSWLHFSGSGVTGDYLFGYLVSPFVMLGWAF